MRDKPSGFQPVEVSPGALFSRALEHCSKRSGKTREAVLARLRSCDSEMHGTFRYALAKELSEYLGSLGVAFRAVYVYGSAMGETSSPCSDIDIILDVEHPTDGIDRLMRGLDIAFVTQFRALFPWAKQLHSLLDVRTIAALPSERKDRYSGGVSGFGTSPVCLWRVSPKQAGVLRKEGPRRPTPSVIGR